MFQFLFCYILERKDKKWFKRDIIVLISFLILFVSISFLVNIGKEMSLPGFRTNGLFFYFLFFFSLSVADFEFSLFMNMEMPTLVGVFIFMVRENFMLSRVEHEKSFTTIESGFRSPNIFCNYIILTEQWIHQNNKDK